VEEANQISKAASSRCLGKKTAPSTYKAIGNIVGMLFVRGLERAQGIYNAMVARGYNGALNLQIEKKPSSLDLIKASLFVFFASLFHLRRLFL
jgi:energy-coupling factor transporter transmembrane protein EcfT